MKRRHFLVGVGSASIGGSALVGSGAYSRVEAQRNAMIQVAGDADAYLGLEGCPDSANQSYTSDDGEGHLTVEMSPENATEAGGRGINSNSRTWFDRVFQICNNGKEEVCVWIGDDDDWPRVPDGEPDEGERRVEFYYEDDPEQSIIGEENAVELDVGDCFCAGIQTRSFGLEDGDKLLEEIDNGIVIHADVDCPEPEIPPEVGPDPDPVDADHAISWASFCVEDGAIDAEDIEITVTGIKDDDPHQPTRIEWTSNVEVGTVTLKGGQQFWQFSGGTSGTATMGTGDDDGALNEQTNPSPCPDGSCGVKFNWENEDGFVEDDHQDECGNSVA